MEQAARDGREFDRLTAVRRRPAVWGALAFVLCAAAAVLAVLWKQSPALGAALLVPAVLGGVKWLLDRRHNRQYEANLDAAQALLARYEQHSRDEFSAFAAAYREQLMRWHQQTETEAREQAQRRRMLDERARQTAQLTGSAAMLRPGVTDMDGAAQAVAAALAEWDGLDAARQEAARAKLRYDTVCAALAGVEERPAPACDLHGWTMPGVQAELTRTELELSSLRSRLDLSRGRLEALGDPAMLAAEQETIGGRIAELEQTYAALELAEQALQDAAAELQSRFSPALTQEAGRLFAALTGGKYDRMLLSRQMDVEAGETAQPSLRPGGYLSAGTQDALYLALRLAVCRLALPEGTPLVLDDALVCFDDARLRSALTLLRGLGATRQILLFTCQSREAALA